MVAPRIGRAPQPGKSATIAVVCGARCGGGGYDSFRQALRDLAKLEGRELILDVRGAEGHPDCSQDPESGPNRRHRCLLEVTQGD